MEDLSGLHSAKVKRVEGLDSVLYCVLFILWHVVLFEQYPAFTLTTNAQHHKRAHKQNNKLCPSLNEYTIPSNLIF